MTIAFYIAAAIAIGATVRVITHTNAVHALLYLIVSLLAVAVVFFILGAPFAAALEVITYAGAIMVLFVFVVMMLNLGTESEGQEQRWLHPGLWVGPSLLAIALMIEFVYLLRQGSGLPRAVGDPLPAREVGATLFGPYLIAVELAGMLLLAALVAAYHLGRRRPRTEGA